MDIPTQVLLCLLNSTNALDRSPGPNATRPPISRNTRPAKTQAGTPHQEMDTPAFCSTKSTPAVNPAKESMTFKATPMVRGVSEAFLKAKFLGRDHAHLRR